MLIKCKMCGGDLNIIEGESICECEFCGTKQTIPNADNEKKANLFNRANRLRMNAEFDKASSVYTSIAAEFPTEAEAYWGLCLCKYGIEYVDDPTTGSKIPTCHRTLSASIMDDADFDQACENADLVAKRIYREEAKAIDRLQRDILSIVANETPYDVFICYKETGDDGNRTEDSVLAQDIYDSLTGKGLKVFFARITLEDKLGRQYEPYIYAALHSAKVMLAVGTQFEYFDAVWVKNEWARFLDMMKTDRQKTLIPCYKGIDAYDMPREFKNLQAQDMGKLGWLQDLTRGVLKLCEKEAGQTAHQVNSAAPTVNSLLQRAQLCLENGEWENADQCAERLLDTDPSNAGAYLVKLMAERKVSNEEQLFRRKELLNTNEHYQTALQFADDALKEQLLHWETEIKNRILEDAKVQLHCAVSAADYESVQQQMQPIIGFLGVSDLLLACEKQIEQIPATLEQVCILKDDYQSRLALFQQAGEKIRTAETALREGQTKREQLLNEIQTKRKESESIHGLFAGKKRNELEAAIAGKQAELSRAEEKVNELQSALARAKQQIPEQPAEAETNYGIAKVYYNAGFYLAAYEYYDKSRGYKDTDELL